MDLREAVCAAESLGYMEYGQRLGVAPYNRNLLDEREKAVAVRDAYLRMAEAAVAHAEYQVRVHSYAPVDSATYIRERGELWDAYMEAWAKANAISQQ